MAKIKFIDNDQSKGIEYDWKSIKKEFDSLGIPDSIWNPWETGFVASRWNMYLSQRSVGKTTQFLLVGLCMRRLYPDLQIVYFRDSEKELTPKNARKLMDTIKAFGYIEKLTDGRFNSCYYYGMRWHYCKLDSDGEIVDKDPEPFMICIPIELVEVLKSTLNVPNCSIIIYDEFIKKFYPHNIFVDMMDLHKTISRFRENIITILLANTIDTESEWFHEFDIYDDVTDIEKGETRTCISEKGTMVKVTYVDIKPITKKRNARLNSLYYGFNNPKLGSITGYGWATDDYQHIPKRKNCEYEVFDRTYKIDYNGIFISLDLVESEQLGLCIFAHYCTKTYDDSIIFTKGTIKNKNEHFYKGYTDCDKIIWELIDQHRIFYQNNRIGRIIEKFIMEI